LLFFAFRWEGGKQKSTTLWNCQSELKLKTLNTCFDCAHLLKAFLLPSFLSAAIFGGSTANEKYHFLCDLCALSEAGGEFSFTYMLSKAWIILLRGKV
jgi:hypothetical protein